MKRRFAFASLAFGTLLGAVAAWSVFMRWPASARLADDTVLRVQHFAAGKRIEYSEGSPRLRDLAISLNLPGFLLKLIPQTMVYSSDFDREAMMVWLVRYDP